MGRTPNYRFDRQQRDKAKAEKKAEKAAAKEAKRLAESGAASTPAPETPDEE
jgi:translation initiation factor 2 alpha subunit (eIF-2alpha)